MFFRAQNLGPLRDAEVDLSKDLIVLAGPNNSGKTYLAWSVYGLHRSRSMPPALSPLLGPWVRKLMESPDHGIDLGEVFAQLGVDLLGHIAAEFRSRLHLCFASESELFAKAKISLRSVALPSRREPSVMITHLVPPSGVSVLSNDRAGSTRVIWTIFGEVFAESLIREMNAGTLGSPARGAATTSAFAALAAGERERVEQGLGPDLYQMITSHLLPTCIIFTADRTDLNIFAKELALKRTELVDEMLDADLKNRGGVPLDLVRRKAARYAWPIRDSLAVANDLANLSKQKSPFAHLAGEIESAMLGGDLNVSESGEMLFSPRGAAEPGLQMQLTASIVRSLSSLVFYFRHLARAGDFIIIDEPEMTLHPDNQRKIARILAKAVRLGFKVMMSTHSDYVLRELNHLVMLSKLPEDKAKELGYDPQWALNPARLGVYLFDEQHAEPVPVEETGFSIKTIDAVVNQLNADEQRLYAALSG